MHDNVASAEWRIRGIPVRELEGWCATKIQDAGREGGVAAVLYSVIIHDDTLLPEKKLKRCRPSATGYGLSMAVNRGHQMGRKYEKLR